jgi:hypothetical protein
VINRTCRLTLNEGAKRNIFRNLQRRRTREDPEIDGDLASARPSSEPLLTRQTTASTDATDDTSLVLTHSGESTNRTRRGLLRRATTKREPRLHRRGTLDLAQNMPKRFKLRWAAANTDDAPEAAKEAVLLDAYQLGLAGGGGHHETLRETEELWENQRGFVFFGRLKFTPNARLPGDAVQWTKSNQRCAPRPCKSQGRRH